MLQRDRFCSVYIAPDEQPLTHQEISQGLAGPRMDDRVRVLKALVKQIINDEAFPRLTMPVIQNLVPIQGESHLLKKILLFYWEVIEKVNPTGNLKDEMILVCNSLRNDLLHSNEYIRGRTLKLVSRIPYRGILEPLQSAILENIKHKNIYVRRNGVVCLYEIYLNFGEDMFSDLDETMEQLLLTEQDLSTKRNAFLLLFHANQQKALQYLDDRIQSDFGDIMQIAILELFRKVCKADPTQKPKLLKSIFHFAKSKSPSVLFECANTLMAVSPTVTSLRVAVGIYMQLAQTQTDNNVKLVVLERLEALKDANQLSNHILDFTQLLGQQSLDIRKKVLSLLQCLVRTEAVPQIVQSIRKEIHKIQHDFDEPSQEFRAMLLQTSLQLVKQFPQCHSDIAQILVECVIFNPKLDDNGAQVVYSILAILSQSADVGTVARIIKAFQQRFYDIQNEIIFKSGLAVMGISKESIKAFDEIKRSIGSLPFEVARVKSEITDDAPSKKQRVKTVILPDGTYGTQIVAEDDLRMDVGEDSHIRKLIMNSSMLAPLLCRTLLRLLVGISDFNKYATQSLTIFCALARYYQQNMNRVDQDALEQVYYAIRVLTNPGDPLDNIKAYIAYTDIIGQQLPKKTLEENSSTRERQIVKQPDELIIFRQLKQSQLYDIDLGDEELAEDAFQGRHEEPTFVQKLTHLVQLTGYGDPVYAEAFVDIHKYDIAFDVLLVNRTSKVVQNVQVEFRTAGESKVLEKPQNTTLQPNQSARVRTSIKFSSSDLGLIHGAIHYENNAGVEQAYLVTKEIHMDMVDFIQPASIGLNDFRKKWSKYEWENRISINTNLSDMNSFVDHISKSLKMNRVTDDMTNETQCYISSNLYAQTKLDDDFLLNISADMQDNKINGFIRIRSKVKGIVVNLGERVKQVQQTYDGN